jgi:exonuclease VII large subunit
VLGRGYAVCWTADRSRVVRDAASLALGDNVRVTLARGELSCEVREKSGTTTDAERRPGER